MDSFPQPSNGDPGKAQSTSADTNYLSTVPTEPSTLPDETTQPDEPQKGTSPSPTETTATEPTKAPNKTPSKQETKPVVTKPVDTKPVNKPEEIPIWKKLYSSYVQVYRAKYDHFALIYIDNDDIPELYMYGNNKSEICSVVDDYMISERLEGVGGGNYHKKSGNFMNVYAENGYLVMRVYHLTNYFKQTFYGREDKSVDPPQYYIEKYTAPVSEEEYKQAVAQFIDVNNLSFMHKNALTYDAILEQLSS